MADGDQLPAHVANMRLHDGNPSQASVVNKSASNRGAPAQNGPVTRSIPPHLRNKRPSGINSNTRPPSNAAFTQAGPVTQSIPPHLRRQINNDTNDTDPASTDTNGNSFNSHGANLNGATANSLNGNGATANSINGNGATANSINGNGATTNGVNGNGTISDGNGVITTNVPIAAEPIPATPSANVQPEAEVIRQSVEEPYATHSAKGWMPIGVLSMPNLPAEVKATIPPVTETVTFSIDFLLNEFGGSIWSPGLIFIPPSRGSKSMFGTNKRTYYTLDGANEPYLPRAPGENGAKLTAFFNKNPADDWLEEIEDPESVFKDVPMFVCNTAWSKARPTKDIRYVYYGNYSQPRWSDKLDYDRMIEQVPLHVKEHWAEELAAQGRDEWVTEALKNHYFPKPSYDGELPSDIPEGIPFGEEHQAHEAKVRQDVDAYIKDLRTWKREATANVGTITKEEILQSFDAADGDDPPALRLWWEYLQCTSWDSHFYDVLVQLQSRNRSYDPRYRSTTP